MLDWYLNNLIRWNQKNNMEQSINTGQSQDDGMRTQLNDVAILGSPAPNVSAGEDPNGKPA